jgi:hypothetical protein
MLLFLGFDVKYWWALPKLLQVTMQSKKNNLYSNAHLFVAAIRVWEHQNSTPPSLTKICNMLSFSVEKGNFLCRKLDEMGIIEIVQGSYGDRLFIRDHINLEDIPKGEEDSRLEEELKKFQDTQKAFSQKIESFRSEQAQKKKDLFAEMEKKLKNELGKKTKTP